jgi:hypothetical protein
MYFLFVGACACVSSGVAKEIEIDRVIFKIEKSLKLTVTRALILDPPLIQAYGIFMFI